MLDGVYGGIWSEQYSFGSRSNGTGAERLVKYRDPLQQGGSDVLI